MLKEGKQMNQKQKYIHSHYNSNFRVNKISLLHFFPLVELYSSSIPSVFCSALVSVDADVPLWCFNVMMTQ